MLSDFRKSINSILYDRVTSPFYGTLMVSWSIWNWRIIYLTFFVDQNKITTNKIDFILSNYCNINHLLFFPLISTVGLLTIVPFITNGAYWLDIKFSTWRADQKNKLENKQLLTLEKSIQLRTEIREQEEKFEKLMETKNEEINRMQKQNSGYHTTLGGLEKTNDELKNQLSNEATKYNELQKRFEDEKSKPKNKFQNVDPNSVDALNQYEELKTKPELYENLTKMLNESSGNGYVGETLNRMTNKIKNYFIVNDVVSLNANGSGYFLTTKGGLIKKYYVNEQFKN